MPRTSPYEIVLCDEERRHLKTAVRRYTSAYWEVGRARIVLYAAEGLSNDQIVHALLDRVDPPADLPLAA